MCMSGVSLAACGKGCWCPPPPPPSVSTVDGSWQEPTAGSPTVDQLFSGPAIHSLSLSLL